MYKSFPSSLYSSNQWRPIQHCSIVNHRLIKNCKDLLLVQLCLSFLLVLVVIYFLVLKDVHIIHSSRKFCQLNYFFIFFDACSFIERPIAELFPWSNYKCTRNTFHSISFFYSNIIIIIWVLEYLFLHACLEHKRVKNGNWLACLLNRVFCLLCKLSLVIW